ncbi:MAG: hypothetical protein P8X98_16535, partial [Woeseiaceae bacterium]
MQTRQTVITARQRSYSDILTRRQELMLLLMERDVIELWAKGCNREPMDSIDAQRFTSMGVCWLSHVQDTYIQYKAGLVEEEVWAAERALMSVAFNQPGFRDWWEHGQQYVSSEFAQVMEESQPAYLVLYDPNTQTWSRPKDGKFAKDVAARASEQG